MNIDISIPHPLADEAERLAHKLGISLNDLYTEAVTAYVAKHQREDVTERLDRVYANETYSMDTVLAELQAAVIRHEAW